LKTAVTYPSMAGGRRARVRIDSLRRGGPVQTRRRGREESAAFSLGPSRMCGV